MCAYGRRRGRRRRKGHLGGKLVEEVEGQAGDERLGVDEEHRHLAHLTFDLENVFEHQLSEDHHGSLPHRRHLIPQPGGGEKTGGIRMLAFY